MQGGRVWSQVTRKEPHITGVSPGFYTKKWTTMRISAPTLLLRTDKRNTSNMNPSLSRRQNAAAQTMQTGPEKRLLSHFVLFISTIIKCKHLQHIYLDDSEKQWWIIWSLLTHLWRYSNYYFDSLWCALWYSHCTCTSSTPTLNKNSTPTPPQRKKYFLASMNVHTSPRIFKQIWCHTSTSPPLP